MDGPFMLFFDKHMHTQDRDRAAIMPRQLWAVEILTGFVMC